MTAEEPTPATIRRVRRADLLAVLRIERASFPQPWSYSAFERFLGEPGFQVAVDEAVLGYIVADTVPRATGPLGHIKDIAVHPDYRGHGFGRTLLISGLQTLATEGADSVKLEVRRSNEPARSLYRDLGFIHDRTAPRYYDDGEDALVMVRSLTDARNL